MPAQKMPLNFYCCAEIQDLICQIETKAHEMRVAMYEKKRKSFSTFDCLEYQINLMQTLADTLRTVGDMPTPQKNELVSKMQIILGSFGCL